MEEEKLQYLDTLERAIYIAQNAFKGETDKAGQPYYQHLKNVQKKIEKKGGDEEQQTIALLHDLLEDIPSWTEEDIKKYFSNRVLKALKAITKREGESYMQYIDRVSGNKDATQVKLADLEDNIQKTKSAIVDEPEEKRNKRLSKYRKAYERLS